MNLEYILKNLLLPFLTSGLATALVMYKFNKNIEAYKSELSKRGSAFQIDKTQFSKRKYELMQCLHLLIVRRKYSVETAHSIFEHTDLRLIRKYFEDNLTAEKELENLLITAFLYIDETTIKNISSYLATGSTIFVTAVSIAENRCREENPDNYRQFNHFKVITNLDSSDNAFDSFKNLNKLARKEFDIIQTKMKSLMTA